MEHSEKKGYQNGAPGVLLLQIVSFFQRGTPFSLIIMFMEKIVRGVREIFHSAPLRFFGFSGYIV